MLAIVYLVLFTAIQLTFAFNDQCNHNIVDYWGQNSYGAANSGDVSGWQQPLRFYCQDDSVDVLPISFLTTFFGRGGEPEINLANYCNSVDNGTFPGTGLANCQNMASDIKYCQSKGKLVTLSLGGATGSVGFQSDAQANRFADTIWNLFLGGQSNTRPFGDAVLDGIDLDIEGGGSNHYVTFLNKLKSYFDRDNKRYYVTAAPQCVYPDANLQSVINQFPMDAVYVQFYNNPCGLQNFNNNYQWNFGVWDIWARTISPNPDVKVYIGAPASISAAGTGYVPIDTLATIAKTTRDKFPSFGGVMFWDASQAYKNNRIDKNIKQSLSNGRNCQGRFEYPACTAPVWSSGGSYKAGDQVSYKYIWAAKWFASQAPSADGNGDWIPVSSCQGNGGSLPDTTTTTSTRSSTTTSNQATSLTTMTRPSQTSSQATPTSTGTACSNLAAWSPSKTYVGTNQVVYQDEIWEAKWWSYNDQPGSSSGAWKKVGPCNVTKRSISRYLQRQLKERSTIKTLDNNRLYRALLATYNRLPRRNPSSV